MKQWVRKLLLSFVMIAVFLLEAAALPSHLIPVGRTVGIQLETQGLLVVGLEDGSQWPGKSAGLKVGDRIIQIGDEAAKSTEQLKNALKRENQNLQLTVERDGKIMSFCILRTELNKWG